MTAQAVGVDWGGVGGDAWLIIVLGVAISRTDRVTAFGGWLRGT